jgi:hypothetical protein
VPSTHWIWIRGDQVLIAQPETNRPHVDLFAGSPGIDIAAAEQAAAALLAAFGVPDGSEAAFRTPARMVAGLAELLSSSPWEFTTFPNREEQHELVLARDVPFTSVCAHHLLPFSGIAQVGVLPGRTIAGLSKLAPHRRGIRGADAGPGGARATRSPRSWRNSWNAAVTLASTLT